MDVFKTMTNFTLKKKSDIFNIYQQFQLRIYMYKIFQFGNVTKSIVSVFYLIF